MKELKDKLELVPASPGVYLFRDREGDVVYVGKARSLRSRLRSYFQAAAPGDTRGEALREDISDFEINVCANEIDALILEATLIKKHRPRYNVILRDDKSFPSIAVTVSESYPRAVLSRGKRAAGTRYYGPYVNARAARSTLNLLLKVFPLRRCAGAVPGGTGGGGGTPCLYSQMKMCAGPCTGEVTEEQYGELVASLCSFLDGKPQPVLEELERRMLAASRAMEYEEAARIRNQVVSARRVLAHDRADASGGGDYDVIGVHSDGVQAVFAVAQNRSGIHLGNLCFTTDLCAEISIEELVTEFVKRYYDLAGSIPKEVLVPVAVEDGALLEWLAAQRGARVAARVPARGKKRRELELASENARISLEGVKLNRARDKARVDASLEELTTALGLGSYPLRIECYDISTMQGAASVGSMVVFRDGLPDRRGYRRFGIKFTPGVDDVGMMKEVLYRRFKRYVRAVAPAPGTTRGKGAGGFERKPDLLLLDGGKGQLGAALEVLDVLGIEGIEVAALAKRNEEVYRPGLEAPVVLARDSEALFLLQRIRDEAHRFAVQYHRNRMGKKTSESWLDGVAGVGRERKKVLVRHFGSPSGVARATLAELEEVRGVPESVARAVYEAGRKVTAGGDSVGG